MASHAALAWAADYARRNHAELRAVHVLRYGFGSPLAWAPGVRGLPSTISEPLVELDKTTIRSLFDGVGPAQSWTLSFLDGPVGQQIVLHAHHAQLLVLGTPERHGLDGLITGSASHYCLTHATCPVVTVPALGSSQRPEGSVDWAVTAPGAGLS
jgi:nucleotide-binding universal stress UspA family protein